jgi:hypothetical protein
LKISSINDTFAEFSIFLVYLIEAEYLESQP